jgi:hypothetical protein
VLSLPSAPDGARLKEIGEFIRADPQRAIAAARLLRHGTPTTVDSEVRGVSMGAGIPDGARIRIACGAVPMTVGTVVAFIAGGRTVVHRIRGRHGDWLITQGDAMRLPDVPVSCDAVLGQVIAVRAERGWQPLAAPPRLPRRDRALSWLVYVAAALQLRLHPPLAQRFLDQLTRAEREHAWTSLLLY